MTRILKAFGLTIAAVLALSALAAPAQAEKAAQLTAEEYPVTIDGEDEPTTGAFTRDGRVISCHVVRYHAETSSNATTITIVPIYENCTSPLGPTTVRMNGCHYILHLTANIVDFSHTYTGITDVVCPKGQSIELLIYTSHTNHTNNAPTCVYKFGDENGGLPTNQGLKGIDLTNKPAVEETPVNWITADVTVEGLHSKRTTGGALLCGKEVDTAAVLHALIELKGTNLLGEPNGITVSTDS